MRIPSVNSLFHSRAGSIMSRVPMIQPASGSFRSAYAAALAQEPGKLQELTILNPAPSTAALPMPVAAQTVTPLYSQANTTKSASALPLYIPAASLKPAADPVSSSVMGQQVVDFAKQYVGTPYVRGGEDLVKGADCSGFTQSVYAHFGVKLPRSSYRQSKVGTEVDVKNLKPGDLLFFKTADYAPVTHVAMYIGNGKIIHASSPKTGVIISRLRIKDDFVIARRLLP